MYRLKKNFFAKLYCSLLLIMLLVVPIFSMSVQAAEAANIKATAVSAEQSKTVDVTISLNNNPGIWGIRFFVGYDHDALTLKSTKVGTVFSAEEITAPPTLSEKEYIFMADRAEISDTKANGELITLTFEVKEDATAKKYPISLKVEDSITAAGADVKLEKVAGSITVTKKPVDPDKPVDPEKPVDPDKPGKPDDGKFPVTGDNTAVLFFIIASASLIAIIGIIAIIKLKSKNK